MTDKESKIYEYICNMQRTFHPAQQLRETELYFKRTSDRTIKQGNLNVKEIPNRPQTTAAPIKSASKRKYSDYSQPWALATKSTGSAGKPKRGRSRKRNRVLSKRHRSKSKNIVKLRKNRKSGWSSEDELSNNNRASHYFWDWVNPPKLRRNDVLDNTTTTETVYEKIVPPSYQIRGSLRARRDHYNNNVKRSRSVNNSFYFPANSVVKPEVKKIRQKRSQVDPSTAKRRADYEYPNDAVTKTASSTTVEILRDDEKDNVIWNLKGHNSRASKPGRTPKSEKKGTKPLPIPTTSPGILLPTPRIVLRSSDPSPTGTATTTKSSNQWTKITSQGRKDGTKERKRRLHGVKLYNQWTSADYAMMVLVMLAAIIVMVFIIYHRRMVVKQPENYCDSICEVIDGYVAEIQSQCSDVLHFVSEGTTSCLSWLYTSVNDNWKMCLNKLINYFN